MITGKLVKLLIYFKEKESEANITFQKFYLRKGRGAKAFVMGLMRWILMVWEAILFVQNKKLLIMDKIHE